MLQHAIIIDPFSSGRFLASEFAARGIPAVAVLSTPVPANFVSSYLPETFVASVLFDGNLDHLCAELAAYSPLCVMIGIETGLDLMDQVAAKLGLPGNNPASSALRRDKYAMQEALHAASVRAVKQHRVNHVDAAQQWLLAHGAWPVIVKPTNSAGSDNVTLCHTMQDALQAVDKILHAANLFGQRNAFALLQEYLDGREWVVDTVSCNGKHVVTNVTRYTKVLSEDSNPIYRHVEFLSPNDAQYRHLVDYALSVIDVLGIQYGAAHVEIIETQQGPTLVEVNARMHGGDAVVALRKAIQYTQLDFAVDAYVDAAAFAKKAAHELAYQKCMIAHFLIARSAGTVVAVAEQEFLRSIGSFAIAYLPALGKEIQQTNSLTTAPGYMWLLNENEQALWADQRQFIELENSGKLYSCEVASAV